MLRQSLTVLALLGALTASGTAHAGDTALAESLFRQGRALMDANDYKSACPKLAESFSQDPATGTLLALALCQEGLGTTASAWASYSEVITRAKRDGQTEREQAAREHMQALEAKLSRLTITVDAGAAALRGLVVKRDGIVLGQAAWGAPAPVDPGEHWVEASAPGKRPWKAPVKLGASADSRTVNVPALQDDPNGATASGTVSGNAVAGGDQGSSSGSPLRTIGLVVGGVGLVGVGVGGYFGLRASSLNTESKNDNHCDANNQCDVTGLAKRDDAVSAATTATIAFVAGGVLAATGITLFLVGSSGSSKRESAKVEAAPALSPGVAGLLVRGRF